MGDYEGAYDSLMKALKINILYLKAYLNTKIIEIIVLKIIKIKIMDFFLLVILIINLNISINVQE